MIAMLRVDDRLIHGMVAVSWTSALKPDTIIVANDKAANDAFMTMTMKMAKPAGVNLLIKTKDQAIEKLNSTKYERKRVFLVTESVEDAWYLAQQVTGINAVNIGTAGIKKQDGQVPTLPQIMMSPADFEFAKKLHEQGAEVFAQVTPSLERMDFKGISKIFEK